MAWTWHEVDRCNFCGGSEYAPYLESKVPKWYEGRPLRLIRCTKCNLVVSSPRPNLDDLYQNYIAGDETARAKTEAKLARPNVREQHKQTIREAQSHMYYKPARLFDMGFGAGTLMMGAKELGLEAEGNDINKAGVDLIQAQGMKAYHGYSRDLNLPDNHYDIVTNLDYIEHSYEPFDDLKTCFRILKPGGVLYLKTLYLGSPDHLNKGESWQLFGLHHFAFFSAATLEALVKAAGFEIADVQLWALITIIARKPGGPAPPQALRARRKLKQYAQAYIVNKL